ncbi:23S rRNA (adenine(1618)-N(6))-methyltransferase RlmF [Pseudoalteromonas piscicida]|uniref:23S rRNA (adenine(1618)-N(6))-methyltransferase RlmF n=1 Tax=Pseudoalteromonas piscicida TaxID=43662 RepID=UPI0030B39020
MHPKNKHSAGYNIDKLTAAEPALKEFVFNKPDGLQSIDFTNPDAVKLLNKALLKTEYQIEFWDIPPQFLCPPVPGRADYIHALNDLLVDSKLSEQVQGLDVGTGANLIYPILGAKEYNWRFVASDINPIAIKCAKTIAELNKLPVKVIQQKQSKHFFRSVIKADQQFHFSMCNPPFHASEEEAHKGTKRKWKNLNRSPKSALNFGGQAQELWCEGGEKRFLLDMISESTEFKEQVYWFTSLVSNKDNIKVLQKQLKQVSAEQVKVIEMDQGNKKSRFIAWSFFKPL